ncbi:UNVERIFIED_CONTAM: hypothetical protein Slati_1714900 [Sesamum latifolium]|uniref:Uncharacterized protein n=1 Tax=Sesamum latifolium TaxID=2727402 RepID=A0AAW2WW18_9LAMI
MTHKFVPAVSVGEASTSKAKVKRVGCWKRKKGKGKAVATTGSAKGTLTALVGIRKREREGRRFTVVEGK